MFGRLSTGNKQILHLDVVQNKFCPSPVLKISAAEQAAVTVIIMNTIIYTGLWRILCIDFFSLLHGWVVEKRTRNFSLNLCNSEVENYVKTSYPWNIISPSTSAVLCQHYPTNALYSSSSTSCSYQKVKWTKHGKLQQAVLFQTLRSVRYKSTLKQKSHCLL